MGILWIYRAETRHKIKPRALVWSGRRREARAIFFAKNKIMCEARRNFAKNKTPDGGFEIWDLRQIKHGTMEPLIYSSQNLKGGLILSRR